MRVTGCAALLLSFGLATLMPTQSEARMHYRRMLPADFQYDHLRAASHAYYVCSPGDDCSVSFSKGPTYDNVSAVKCVGLFKEGDLFLDRKCFVFIGGAPIYVVSYGSSDFAITPGGDLRLANAGVGDLPVE